MNVKNIFTLSVLLSFLVGCSWMPYEEEFACTRNPTYGKCVSVQGAYDEAVTGKAHGKVITKDGVSDEEEEEDQKKNSVEVSGSTEEVAYNSYRAELYKQLKSLVASPETPVVKRAVENRTLILSYSPNNQRQRLYMPRYIQSIHQPAEFVLGQYRLDSDPAIRQIKEFLNQGEDK